MTATCISHGDTMPCGVCIPDQDQPTAPGDQPPPVPNDGPSAHEHAVAIMKSDVGVGHRVAQDLAERAKVGLERYGTRLQPHNGRDAGWDGYQESLDAVAYAAQVHLEAQGGPKEDHAKFLLALAWAHAGAWSKWAEES